MLLAHAVSVYAGVEYTYIIDVQRVVSHECAQDFSFLLPQI